MITLKCMTMALCKLEPRLAGKWNIDTYQHVLTTNQIQLLGQWASAAKYYTLPTRGVVISIVSSISIEMTSWFRPSKPNVESSIQPHLQPSGPSGMQRGEKKHTQHIKARRENSDSIRHYGETTGFPIHCNECSLFWLQLSMPKK